MAQARQEVELTIRLGNEPGALGKVLALVAKAGVTVLAHCAYFERQEAVALLVTDNATLAQQALETAGYRCRANPVVVVHSDDRIGGAAVAGARLGYAGINILYSYATARGSSEFYAVFKTTNDARALQLLTHATSVRAA